MQERRILSMQRQIEELADENKTLRLRNKELENREFTHQKEKNLVEELKQELAKSISEANSIKEQYQQAIYEVQKIKKDDRKQFKELIRQLRMFN
jgi:regulator of replication initiation timing